MVWLAVIVGGILAGIIAKAIVPGNEPGGFVIDAVIGIVGGILGKLVMNMVGLAAYSNNALWNLIVAVIGAIILLVIYHAVTGNRRGITTM